MSDFQFLKTKRLNVSCEVSRKVTARGWATANCHSSRHNGCSNGVYFTLAKIPRVAINACYKEICVCMHMCMYAHVDVCVHIIMYTGIDRFEGWLSYLERLCFAIPCFQIVFGGDSGSMLVVDRDFPGSNPTSSNYFRFLIFRLNSA